MRLIAMFLVLLATVSTAYAQGGIGGTGGVGGNPPLGGGGGFGGMCGMHGIIGMRGCCGGGVPCIHGFSGCCGGFSFSGNPCFGQFCGFNGCFGGTPAQSYSSWKPSPASTYYYRTLTVRTMTPTDAAIEFVLIHHPERPKFYYFYDPVEKKFFGRVNIGARPEQCFSLLPIPNRKGTLKEIADANYVATGPMPTFAQVIRPRPGTTVEPALQNIKLLQPPESVPDALLGLPPEEPTLKKK